MPFFSIILPTYNRRPELERSLESVFAQACPDFEVIVVDDGSTDDTADFIRRYSDERLKYIYQSNSERSAARNRGIREAFGSYLCFLDCGDIFYPNHLQTLKDRILSDGQPAVLYKTLMNYEHGHNSMQKLSYKGSDRDSALRYVWENGSQMNSLCLHREIAENELFPEQFFWFEDMHWICRIVLSYPLRQVDTFTCKYFNSGTTEVYRSGYLKYLENCEACIRDLERRKGVEIRSILGSGCFDSKVAELYLGLVVSNAVLAGDIKTGFDFIKKAIALSFTPRLAGKYAYYSLKLLKAGIWKGGR